MSFPALMRLMSPSLREGSRRVLVPEERRGAGHVRADGDRPHGELVPGQQVAREGQKKRQHQEEHSDVPVEFAGRLVRTRS